MSISKVSLIICTYNRDEPLVNCVKSALAQTYSLYEVIVVDQTKIHSLETIGFFEENKSKLVYLTPDFASITKARNLGIKHASGEIIIFVDDDTTFDKNFITNHVEALSKGYDLVQGKILEEGSRIKKSPVWLNAFGNFSGSDTCPHDGITNNITGCNFSFRHEILEKQKGFDENYQGMSVHEDTDFGYRAYKNGYRMFFSAKAQVFHHKAVSGGVGNNDNAYLNYFFYRNKLYFYFKNFPSYVVLYQLCKLMIKGIRHFLKMYFKVIKDVKKLIN